jgi:tetratricopeptide (TPR) repeat protein
MNKGSPFGTGGQAAVRKTLETAITAIRAGALDEAERILLRDAAALATPIGQNILGDVRLKRGAARDALKAFDQALKLAPQMPEAYCNRSAALHALGRFEDAVAAADRALRYRPNYATAHFNRGNALSALGRHEAAAAAFGKAIAAQPKFPEAHLNRGYAHIALGGWLEAVADFGKALAMRPGMPPHTWGEPKPSAPSAITGRPWPPSTRRLPQSRTISPRLFSASTCRSMPSGSRRRWPRQTILSRAIRIAPTGTRAALQCCRS